VVEGWGRAQARGELEQIVEAQVALSALDLAEEGPVDIALLSKRLLAETKRVAVPTNPHAERARSNGDDGIANLCWLGHPTNQAYSTGGRSVDNDLMIVITASITAVAGLVGYMGAIRIGPKLGVRTPRDLPPRRRRLLWLMITATLGVSFLIILAITHGAAVLGIGMLVVIALSQFVLTLFRVRRSQRRAKVARAIRNAVRER
jgi:hypothetical protein